MKTGNFDVSSLKFSTKGLRIFHLLAIVFCAALVTAATAQENIVRKQGGFFGADKEAADVGRRVSAVPTISQISTNTLPQAGRLKITGANFGAVQGASFVRFNGGVAPVSSWSDTLITAYASDSSTLGAGVVQVITQGGASNGQPLTVTARPAANGRVQWRFQADDLYIQGRAAVGTDGTVYAAGVGGHLYALTPNGGLKWIFRGSFPVVQSVSVGADNTAYFAGGNVVYAVNADGTLKWQIVNPSGGAFAAGPNVGPDGNTYAVANLGNAENNQLGAITVSPAGQIINNRPGYIEPRGGNLFTREIVFGSNQFYFGGLNNAVFGTGGLEVFQLGGNYRLTISAAGGRQPAVAPDGTVYAVRGGNPGTPERLGAFSPTNGSLLRTILPTETYLGYPDIGADGTIYITHNLSVISRYTPTGANLWNFNPGGTSGDAVVNPQNTIVSAGGYEFSEPGAIYGLNVGDGQLLWTVNLPAENGGYVRASSRARFTPDGATVYYGTDVNDYAPDVYSYLYAITATPTLAGCTPSVAITEDISSQGDNLFTVTAGVNSAVINPARSQTGLQTLTLVSATNATVNVPSVTPDTTTPVTVTYTVTNPNQPVDITLRATGVYEAILIRLRCGGAASFGLESE